jgi:hypothetical protein
MTKDYHQKQRKFTLKDLPPEERPRERKSFIINLIRFN